MAGRAESKSESRWPLNRDRVLEAAVRIADDDGIDSLTMRRLAEELGAEAMSLYYHVANKEDVLDGVVGVVVREINEMVDRIDMVATGANWKQAMREWILSARQVLLRHPWAPHVMVTRSNISPEVLRYFESLVALMRGGGFSYDVAHHGLHTLGSRALGFTPELFDSGDGCVGEEATAMLEGMADRLPHLAGMLAAIAHDDPDSTRGWCDAQAEFEFGLDLVLDGLDRLRRTA